MERRSQLLRETPPSAALGVAVSVVAVAAITALIYPLREVMPTVSTGVIYLPVVLAISIYWGLRLGLLTSLLSATAFNFFHIPPSTSMPRPFSRGYDVLAGGTWPRDVTATSPTIAGSAGAIVSTPGDLQTFMRALLRGRLVSRSLLAEMKRPTPGSLDGPNALEGGGVGTYGLGLIHYTWSKACGVWGHTGAFPGYRSIAVSNRNGRRGAAMYITSEALAPPGAIAGLEAERLLACRMRFGRIGS